MEYSILQSWLKFQNRLNPMLSELLALIWELCILLLIMTVRLSNREARFHRDINHIISKKIVAKAKGTKQAIALEDLKGIRKSVTVRRTQRSRLHSWAFYQLRSFIEYKAALAGIFVYLVNPRGTSHICPECKYNERANRPNRDTFRCVQCGFSGNADHIAAINIAARAVEVNQRIVACYEVKALIGIEMEHSDKPHSFSVR